MGYSIEKAFRSFDISYPHFVINDQFIFTFFGEAISFLMAATFNIFSKVLGVALKIMIMDFEAFLIS